MPVIPIPLLFPIPTDEDDFEDLCQELLRLYWRRPGLVRFGRKGERQFGIDILDLGGMSPLHGAQCKLREYGKTLSPTTISDEIREALKFRPALGKYGILTTAKVSTQAQTRILEINQSHRDVGAFEVELFTWDKLCTLLQEYGTVREAFYGSIVIAPTSRIGLSLSNAAIQPPPAPAEVVQSSVSTEIDAAREAIGRHEFQIALLLLNRILERADGTIITDFERFRISSNLAIAHIGLGKPEAAAQHFLDAVRFAPEDERARINEVFAYILLADNQAAHNKAQGLRSVYPQSAKLTSYWVMSAPLSMSLATIETELGSAELSDPDVSLALARRALMEFDVVKALAYAEVAAKAAPSSSQAQLVTAQAIFGRLVGVGKLPGESVTPRAELENRIESALAEALRLAEAQHDDRTQIEALVQRSNLRLVQKRASEAQDDASNAHRLDPDDVHVIITLSQLRSSASDLDESIKLLERAHRINPLPDVEFMYGRALLRRGRPEDLDLAVVLLSAMSLASLPAPM